MFSTLPNTDSPICTTIGISGKILLYKLFLDVYIFTIPHINFSEYKSKLTYDNLTLFNSVSVFSLLNIMNITSERMKIMNKEDFKYELVDNIIIYLKYQILSEIEEDNKNMPIFKSVLNIINNMNDYEYSYTLKDIDEKLFDKLIQEIITILNLKFFDSFL